MVHLWKWGEVNTALLKAFLFLVTLEAVKKLFELKY